MPVADCQAYFSYPGGKHESVTETVKSTLYPRLAGMLPLPQQRCLLLTSTANQGNHRQHAEARPAVAFCFRKQHYWIYEIYLYWHVHSLPCSASSYGPISLEGSARPGVRNATAITCSKSAGLNLVYISQPSQPIRSFQLFVWVWVHPVLLLLLLRCHCKRHRKL